MVFASLLFLFLFLPLNLVLYYSIANYSWRNAVLIVFSLFFYSWGEPIWISLLICSSMLDWANAMFIERYRNVHWGKVGLVFTVFLNLGLLATFKYGDFLVSQVNLLLGTSWKGPGFGLPIGISFYTFHTISYVVDVYRGQISAQRQFPKFLMYVSLYSSLVAGPIIRYADVAHEIDKRNETIRDFSLGVTRFCIGLFKKVVLANIVAELVRKYMGDGSSPEFSAGIAALSTAEAWTGLIMFSLQIYFDFSGYSDMAIGLGRMFGFHFRENFNYPYISTSVSDFWRRWHISLSSIFRDYVYIPLGGNRKRPYLNLLIVWFLTGFWHGASWNFIWWGLYFFVFIALEKAFLQKIMDHLPTWLAHVYALSIIVPGWVIFFFTDSQMLFTFFNRMFTISSPSDGYLDWMNTVSANVLLILTAIIVCIPIYPWFQKRIRSLGMPRIWLHTLSIGFNFLLFFLCIAQLVGKSYNPFIYFRF